jgi:hypothetical protein
MAVHSARAKHLQTAAYFTEDVHIELESDPLSSDYGWMARYTSMQPRTTNGVSDITLRLSVWFPLIIMSDDKGHVQHTV